MGQEFGQTSEWNAAKCFLVAARPLAPSGRAGAGPRPQPALPRNARAACARLRARRLPLDRRQRRHPVGVRLAAPRSAERPAGRGRLQLHAGAARRLPSRPAGPGPGARCSTPTRAYGGSNVGNFGGVTAEARPSHGFPASATLTLPPLATLFLVFSPPEAFLTTELIMRKTKTARSSAFRPRTRATPWPTCWPAGAAAA